MLLLSPDLGVPMDTERRRFDDFHECARAACNTVIDLEKHGLNIDPTDEDQYVATALVQAYAEKPEEMNKTVSAGKMSQLSPASILMINRMMDEFGRSVVDSAARVRHLVMNKLILETDNDDAKVRLRALELLGKIQEVGLFTNKSEVTITHKGTDDLREQLRSKLHRLIDADEEQTIEDAQWHQEDWTPAEKPLDVDLEEELGEAKPYYYD